MIPVLYVFMSLGSRIIHVVYVVVVVVVAAGVDLAFRMMHVMQRRVIV